VRFQDALLLELRLTENIEEATRYGSTETNRADRARILEQLNSLSMTTFGVPFAELPKPVEDYNKFSTDEVELFDFDLVHIEDGCFVMGSLLGVDPDAQLEEHPMHCAYVKQFAISRTTITNAQYVLFVNDSNHPVPSHWTNRRAPPGRRNHPVVNVTLYDAIAYCEWLTHLFKQPFSLPSEAEWEKAARGMHALIYPWGNKWETSRANTVEMGLRDTLPVSELTVGQSSFGLLHMAGNVFEWTRTIWGLDEEKPDYVYPYDENDGREALGTGPEVYRVVRGGAFNTSAKNGRTTARRRYKPDRARTDVGFRIVSHAAR